MKITLVHNGTQVSATGRTSPPRVNLGDPVQVRIGDVTTTITRDKARDLIGLLQTALRVTSEGTQ